jgi:hypothetical protein
LNAALVTEVDRDRQDQRDVGGACLRAVDLDHGEVPEEDETIDMTDPSAAQAISKRTMAPDCESF